MPAKPVSPQRRTRQRAAVDALLGRLEDFHTAQQIHDLLRDQGESVGLATVYRNLQAMADNGEVDVLRTDQEALYRRCTDSHHHHLVCRDCGSTVEVEGPEVEEWAERVAKANGYSDVGHVVEIFGRCAECTAAAAESPRR